MDRQAAKTLVLPFERQNLAFPTSDNRWLFLNAHPLENAVRWKDGLVCEQGFRPVYLQLQNAGFDTVPAFQADKPLSGALVLTSRFKDLNQAMLAKAVSAVSTNGSILVAGEKTSGIAPLRKWAAQHTEIIDAFSKFHAQAFQFLADDNTKAAMRSDKEFAKTGIFGSGKIDRGSQLLASTFDMSMTGNMADFCAGTGYLARQLLEKTTPQSINLYEAEHRALEIARDELAGCGIPMDFHWCDLAGEPVTGRYDWIVMNPPFHAGRAADPSIGQNMIRAARKALRPGGHLRLVANRQLPYEKTLTELFGGFREIVAENGFKVLQV